MFFYLFFILAGYLCGSLMFAYLLPKYFCQMDICAKSADKNPGTANAYLQCGFFIGTATLLLELLKGFLPVYFAARCVPVDSPLFSMVVAAPVFGHAFPVFPPKKGGKAIAVSFGVLLGLFPVFLPVLFLAVPYILFSTVVYISSHTLRSIVTFCTFAILVLLFVNTLSLCLAALLISAVVIGRHIACVKRQ